ncbi:bifunctional (p)ppGpp synthetase/guanosine-3',5'-bis(diphosphate) 3'-pyrophosphohydrolase [Puteibacter caeruleilacunae]|nr:bifunctional (p)ppGpp synthetase/guanosine-3',5'-bis(diphosphate) 3'-pyrophosphohydrolase [Puteibacter caeruleilacunae]
MTKNLQSEADKRLIKDYFDNLLEACKKQIAPENIELIKKAFKFANKAHAGVRRKSGEPYIIHPIAVAHIVVSEIGLGSKSVIAALLHDIVEDTDYTLEDISGLFSPKIAQIVDGLTKLSGSFDSSQAENFKKMLLTLSEDVRVILIKLADRLHNMRTLESMPAHKQLKIAGETLFIYAPLAHRLGLYSIKTQLEDLSLKYEHPDAYEKINLQLRDKKEHRDYLVNNFIAPLETKLENEGIDFSITSRPKSIYSIWNKMQKKGVSFNEIYDILAVRIVFKSKDEISEKRQCFDVLSLITDIYKPKPDRIRDWITIPKANGYEALHVTVMGPQGKWVEVQIRTVRMDEIAERGFAAHFKYKGKDGEGESELDRWLIRIREMLRNPEVDALEFLDEFKLNLFSSEIVVFTPKGKMITLPKNSTVLDFAYDIHTDLGNTCIGAKINHKLVPVSHSLKSGDQIEILTSDKQQPQPNWLKFVVTAKAKSKVRDAFKLTQKKHIEKGRDIIDTEFKKLKIIPNSNTIRKILNHYGLSNKEQLYSQIGMSILKIDDLSPILRKKSENRLVKYWRLSLNRGRKKEEETPTPHKINKKQKYLLEEKQNDVEYSLARCCNPIPGDEVLGYLVSDENLVIHKTKCPEAIKLMSSHGDKIVAVEWTPFKVLSYLTKITMQGFDRIGIVNEITNVISKQHNINMRSINFDTHDGVFEGNMFLYIHNTEDLNNLIASLMKVKGMEHVERIENLYE